MIVMSKLYISNTRKATLLKDSVLELIGGGPFNGAPTRQDIYKYLRGSTQQEIDAAIDALVQEGKIIER